MSESDSVRDECSSGIRSDGEDEPPPPRRGTISWGDGGAGGHHTPQHGSSSTLSSCSTTSQAARLIQSSNAVAGGGGNVGGGTPPMPPPRTSSAGLLSSSGADNTPPSDLGKQQRSTCMQCYLSGHSDGSIESVEPSTEGSSSACGTPSTTAPPPPTPGTAMSRDRDSGLGSEATTAGGGCGRPMFASGRMRQSESRDSGIVERETSSSSAAHRYVEPTVQFKNPIVQYEGGPPDGGGTADDRSRLCRTESESLCSEPDTSAAALQSAGGGVGNVQSVQIAADSVQITPPPSRSREPQSQEPSTDVSERSSGSGSPEAKSNSGEDVCGEGPPPLSNRNIKIKITKSEFL